jgi:DNA polymerase-3 subunit delta'
MPHAVLLHGPRGVGKKILAEHLAQALLCETPDSAGGCGHCKACHWFAQGGHPDYRLIEPSAEEEEGAAKKGGRQITIKEIRALGDFLSLAAHQGGWRIVVVHPAEAMNAAAANALLKTLEEPPANVLIILISHQPSRLLATVISRCRKVPVGLPKWDMAMQWLDEQGLTHSEALLCEAGGAPLTALEYADVERMARRERFISVLRVPTMTELSGLAQEFQGHPDEAWGWLTRWTHDLVRAKHQIDARYFPEHAGALKQLVGGAALSDLLDLERELRMSGRWLRHPLNGQLLLESWLLRYATIATGTL